jgi:hypothetical protein
MKYIHGRMYAVKLTLKWTGWCRGLTNELDGRVDMCKQATEAALLCMSWLLLSCSLQSRGGTTTATDCNKIRSTKQTVRSKVQRGID